MARRGGDVRVLVIDDSQTARELLVAILQTSEGIRVIGSGVNGAEAVRLTQRMRPDVILMDINMPKLDGLEATREIMSEIPTPIVLITGTLMLSDMDLSFKALQAGALTVIPKPGLSDPEACDLVVEKVRAMADVPIVRRWRRDKQGAAQPTAPEAPIWSTPISPGRQLPPAHIPSALSRSELARPFRLIGIGASTGGPGALATILRPLPADFPLPILIVQHVTPGFAIGLAEWIDSETQIRVRLAAHGMRPEPGVALIAPDAYHMQVNFRGLIELNKEAPYRGLRPSVNYLFDSMARTCGPRALGILMTGMGDDGADGLTALHAEGGLTIAQDEATCIVYGMPREAVIRGGVSAILSLDEIAQTLSYLADGAGRT